MIVVVADDVRDRHVESGARGLHDAALEPVRRAGRVRRDDDRVGGEAAQRVLEGLQGVTVTDLTAHVETSAPQRLQGSVEPCVCRVTRAVLVGCPRPNPGVERRADDEDILRHAVGHVEDLLAQPISVERLVGDHENPPGVLDCDVLDMRSRSRLLPPSAQHPERGACERDEDDEREPGRDQGGDHDQAEVHDRAEEEAKRRLLALERVPHRRSRVDAHS